MGEVMGEGRRSSEVSRDASLALAAQDAPLGHPGDHVHHPNRRVL